MAASVASCVHCKQKGSCEPCGKPHEACHSAMIGGTYAGQHASTRALPSSYVLPSPVTHTSPVSYDISKSPTDDQLGPQLGHDATTRCAAITHEP